MNKRRVTLAASAAGVLTGVVGLGVLAMPAGAGSAPDLPPISDQALVESVLTAKPAAFGGTVDVSNNLGIPAITGIPQLSDGASKAQVWTDGEGRVRLQLPGHSGDRTIIDDGQTTWTWNSSENKVGKATHGEITDHQDPAKTADPVTAGRDAIAAVKEFSTVTVDGTARVANRPAYELVLTPKPSERTVLREIRVAVDSELRIPLRLAVLTNGTNEPAAQIGFSEFNAGPQDPELFRFTPPAGAKVEEGKPEDLPAETPMDALAQAQSQVIGSGWDTVFAARIPGDMLAQVPAEGQGLVDRFAKPVNGAWGSGKLISSKVGNVLLADDGRVAAGAVPEQVLFEAIGQVK